MEIKNTLNSKFIVDKFGMHSEIYLEVMKFLNERSISEKLYKSKFELWKKDFNIIYGEAISSELFLKHTYFIQILKILISSKISSIKDNTELNSNYIEKKIFNFTYFFWISLNNDLLNKINDEIGNCIIEKEDLFSQFYQHLFISNIRHKRGEFFTPSQLVNTMLEDFYEFGLKILDPSCGSGNFLIGIVLKILNSQHSLSNKIKAINQVYGFDVNPLAIITTKVSILLLFIENLKIEQEKWPNINVFLCDSLFPENCKNQELPKIEILFNTFDLIIGNPPWLTYKDLFDKIYQRNIRELSGRLGIKPLSQYITHIELAAVFFYAIPSYFLKKHGKIFFVMPKSVLNGDHCHKFRSFNIFNIKLEIWDFPDSYMFNVDHICLKAEYIGKDNSISIAEHYPIKTKIYDSEGILIKETEYSSLQISEDGAKLILPIHELKMLKNLQNSPYKNLFYQGATLVPRTLVFFRIRSGKNGILIIDSDPDILSRAKEKWIFHFENKEIEENFHFKTFLNMHLIPFHLHSFKDVFLPINAQFTFDPDYLQMHPKAQSFYNEMNSIYIANKKKTSKITTLYDNLNYWNKLQKQINNKSFLIVYNASGSNLKAAVINNEDQKVVVGSENYYYSSDSEEEVYYLSAILNAPGLSKRIKQIKSSRHIHKRPFMFPIPIYDENNPSHGKLAKTGKKCHIIVQELFMNNPKITADKVRIFINRKLAKINDLTEQILYS
ncbi:MAG: Eco57I restriction-modification methylase domain-containing protein [Promethearchaeota archaeon]